MVTLLVQALLLTSWVRTSFFSNELAQQHLDIDHVPYSNDQASLLEAFRLPAVRVDPALLPVIA